MEYNKVHKNNKLHAHHNHPGSTREITLHVRNPHMLSDTFDFRIFRMLSVVKGHKLLNLEEEKRPINLCLVALLCDQHLPIHEWRCQDIDKVLLHGRCFHTSASSSTEIPGQNSILRKLPTTGCWFQVKMGKDIEQLLAISKSKCPSLVEANPGSEPLNCEVK